MKKILRFAFLVSAISMIAISGLFAEAFIRENILDDFGDSTGKTYIRAMNDYKGTYKIRDLLFKKINTLPLSYID